MENAGPEATKIHLPVRWIVLEQALHAMGCETQPKGDTTFAEDSPTTGALVKEL